MNDKSLPMIFDRDQSVQNVKIQEYVDDSIEKSKHMRNVTINTNSEYDMGIPYNQSDFRGIFSNKYVMNSGIISPFKRAHNDASYASFGMISRDRRDQKILNEIQNPEIKMRT